MREDPHDRLERPQCGSVGHVQLHALADGPRVPVAAGAERHGAEPQPRELQRRERPRQRVPLEPRRADQLERERGPAPLGEVGPLQEHQPRVERHRLGRGQAGRGWHERQRRRTAARPAGHRRDAQVDVQVARPPGNDLADRATVLEGDVEVAEERPQRRVERRAVDARARQRRPVAHDHPGAGLGSGFAQQRGGGRVGVAAQPHLLHVDDHRVQRAQHVGARPAARPVEAVDRQPGARVAAVVHRGRVVLETAPAVFGGQERDQVDPGCGAQRLERRGAGGGQRGLVGEQRDAPAVEEPSRIGEQRVDAADRCAHRSVHPLTAPAVSPAMNCRDMIR